ncbi:MAG: BolA/IbaG family iron-sulfur metabolism protein [Alphaproteobacteria bacterium]|nr:BolA/IbaG family iron-sulfur metabolism protein [Alphaproteobacteria bacterium]
MMESTEIERLIKESLPDARITIKDLRGDGDHYEAHIESSAFAGKSKVDQHRMVFSALQGRVGGIIQTLALTTTAVSQ